MPEQRRGIPHMISSNDCAREVVVLDLDIDDDGYGFGQSVVRALSDAESELKDIDERIEESVATLRSLKPQCDRVDYALAAASGALCGILDVFLVGGPGQSPLGEVTDRWYEGRVKDFARLCGWNQKDGTLSSAILHLGRRFGIPYDQRGAGDAASAIFEITPRNHHFKSLGHNPTLLGLFFSVLDQFSNTSHFITRGKLISIQEADGKFNLYGHDVPSKLFSAFVNWFGHILSDVSGSESSKSRGMGIPSPIWCWTNDVIAIKQGLGIPESDFDIAVNELALKIYNKGYDARFQTAQAIPVFINELLVRLMYGIRRAVRYLSSTDKGDRSSAGLWQACEPFTNSSVRRMLTVAHGTFCLVDLADATIHGLVGGGNAVEFVMRLNVVGAGRFAVSLYGEVSRGFRGSKVEDDVCFLRRKRVIVEDYVAGLRVLADLYDDEQLLTLVDDLKESKAYKTAFEKSVSLAEKRRVPEERILRTKDDIDDYFMGGSHGYEV